MNQFSNQTVTLLATLAIAVIGFNAQADAALTFSIGSPGSTTVTVDAAPGQFLDFYIRSDSDDGLFTATADFLFPTGSLFSSADFEFADSTGNSPGYIGNGNVESGTLNDLAGSGSTGVTLNQEFDMAEIIPAVPGLLFRISLDASALAAGDYSITIDDSVGGFLGETDFVPLTATTLGLTVVAVPEPTTLLAVGMFSVFAYRRHRRNAGSF